MNRIALMLIVLTATSTAALADSFGASKNVELSGQHATAKEASRNPAATPAQAKSTTTPATPVVAGPPGMIGTPTTGPLNDAAAALGAGNGPTEASGGCAKGASCPVMNAK